EVARQEAQLIGERPRARDAGERNYRARRRAAGLHASVGCEPDAQRREQRQAQRPPPAGGRDEPPPRPPPPPPGGVEQKAKGHRGGGLWRGSRVAQCICWMPGRSQPVEPLAGFTRFHTSSKPTASVPGVSRTMPEKRTAAQCSPRSVASSSRSAFSA